MKKKCKSKTYFCILNSKTDTEHILKIYFISNTLPSFNNTFFIQRQRRTKKKTQSTYTCTYICKHNIMKNINEIYSSAFSAGLTLENK